MSLHSLLRDLRLDSQFTRNVTAWQRLPAQPARHADFPPALDARLIAALRARGIEQPYSHQVEAVEAALHGENVVVVTPTASGKTLCYNLPVLHALLRNPDARALYLFPTKALAHDQLHELGEFIAALEARIRAHAYDGDTLASHRRAIRREAHIIVTNPDMLHTGILPHHTQWAETFENLHYVVIDEIHAYRGIFGSHVANVLRRLSRVCAFYGSRPQFLCASATIGNPAEHAERLIEAPVTLIDQNGAPAGEKHFVFYNPPVVDEQLGIRRSAVLEAQAVARRFLSEDAQTVVFARARLTVEVLLTYLRDLAAGEGRLPESVRGYRGGYLPNERRTIERGLRDGSVRGVVATNALELGVDIGRLAACVMTGYPGTIASTWQQAGRAGRTTDVSAAVLVAGGSPLDQYIVAHPRFFFERSPEHALINPDNLIVLLNHLRCAAFELPFAEGEGFGRFASADALLAFLEEEGVLVKAGQRWHWMSEGYPAADVSLRTGTATNFVVVSRDEYGEAHAIGEVDSLSAPSLIHEEAIYIHEGQQYQVMHLDWEGHLAEVRPVEVDYYTTTSGSADVQVIEVADEATAGGARRAYGDVQVVSKVTGFKKVKLYTHETLGWGEIDLPEQTMETTGYWFSLTEPATQKLVSEGLLRFDTGDRGPNWAEQRDKARQRDGFRCQHCGAPERPHRQHDVHHLRPFQEFGYRPGQNTRYLEANRLENLITLCASCHRRAEAVQRVRGALAGLAYVLRHIAPLYLMCDPRDIGVFSETRWRFTGKSQKAPRQAAGFFTQAPTICIFDNVPGGTGFSERLFELHETLLIAAREVVAGCACRSGCPSCVGPAAEGGEATKQNALRLLEVILN
jgi:DEAD/DEAH box helicase domain-containing protein